MTTPAQPSTFPPCEDCGGVQVGTFRLEGGYGVLLRSVRSRDVPKLEADAVVCTSCGRVKLFVVNLRMLRETAQAHPDRFVW